jgi:hypothetical protein
MGTYSGAIDYMIFKLKSKYIVILLDNHNPGSYCSGPMPNPNSNIDNLFESFIDKDSSYILEELVPTQTKEKFIELYPQTPHLVKYMKFYSKYKSQKNKIIPIDLRILFDNFSQPDKFDLLDQVFELIPCVNPDVQTILSTISLAKKIFPDTFIKHFSSLKQRYQELKQMIGLDQIKCNGSSFLDQIYLNYPFESVGEENQHICEHIEQLLSGLFEMYGIAQILVSQSKYVFVYLGAVHCISIGWFLEKHYQIRKIKHLNNFETNGKIFSLGLLDKSTKSCVNFQPI